VAALARRLPGGAQRAATGLLVLLRELIPFGHTDMAEVVRGLTKTASGLEIAALVVIVWGSSGIFMPVEMALNRAWGGRPNRHFLRSRVLAVLMTLLGGLLALASVALTVASRLYGRDWPLLARHGGKLSALALSYLLFFLVYRIIPEVNVTTRQAARAAFVAGTIWEIAKYVFVARLPTLGLAAFYGPLAFSVSLVLWAYVSSVVLVLGALVASGGPAGAGKAKAAR
jgi:membrane protein/epoxyqueuosine reductase